MKRTDNQTSNQSTISTDNLITKLNADSRIGKIREAILRVPVWFFESEEKKQSSLKNIFFLLHFRFTIPFFCEGDRQLQLREFAHLFYCLKNDIFYLSFRNTSSKLENEINALKSRLDTFDFKIDKNYQSHDAYFLLRKQIINMKSHVLYNQFDEYKNWVNQLTAKDRTKIPWQATIRVNQNLKNVKNNQPMENEERHREVFLALENPLTVQVSDNAIVNTLKRLF